MASRSVIKPKVVRVIAANANMKKSAIKETHDLRKDLLMGETVIKGMADPYTKISLKHGGKRITIPEAKKLKKVKASIDLVHRRANET